MHTRNGKGSKAYLLYFKTGIITLAACQICEACDKEGGPMT